MGMIRNHSIKLPIQTILYFYFTLQITVKTCLNNYNTKSMEKLFILLLSLLFVSQAARYASNLKSDTFQTLVSRLTAIQDSTIRSASILGQSSQKLWLSGSRVQASSQLQKPTFTTVFHSSCQERQGVISIAAQESFQMFFNNIGVGKGEQANKIYQFEVQINQGANILTVQMNNEAIYVPARVFLRIIQSQTCSSSERSITHSNLVELNGVGRQKESRQDQIPQDVQQRKLQQGTPSDSSESNASLSDSNSTNSESTNPTNQANNSSSSQANNSSSSSNNSSSSQANNSSSSSNNTSNTDNNNSSSSASNQTSNPETNGSSSSQGNSSSSSQNNNTNKPKTNSSDSASTSNLPKTIPSNTISALALVLAISIPVVSIAVIMFTYVSLKNTSKAQVNQCAATSSQSNVTNTTDPNEGMPPIEENVDSHPQLAGF